MDDIIFSNIIALGVDFHIPNILEALYKHIDIAECSLSLQGNSQSMKVETLSQSTYNKMASKKKIRKLSTTR